MDQLQSPPSRGTHGSSTASWGRVDHALHELVCSELAYARLLHGLAETLPSFLLQHLDAQDQNAACHGDGNSNGNDRPFTSLPALSIARHPSAGGQLEDLTPARAVLLVRSLPDLALLHDPLARQLRGATTLSSGPGPHDLASAAIAVAQTLLSLDARKWVACYAEYCAPHAEAVRAWRHLPKATRNRARNELVLPVVHHVQRPGCFSRITSIPARPATANVCSAFHDECVAHSCDRVAERTRRAEARWDVADLLVQPVQRITRYALLLDQLAATLAAVHAADALAAVERACTAMRAIAHAVDEARHDYERRMRARTFWFRVVPDDGENGSLSPSSSWRTLSQVTTAASTLSRRSSRGRADEPVCSSATALESSTSTLGASDGGSDPVPESPTIATIVRSKSTAKRIRRAISMSFSLRSSSTSSSSSGSSPPGTLRRRLRQAQLESESSRSDTSTAPRSGTPTQLPQPSPLGPRTPSLLDLGAESAPSTPLLPSDPIVAIMRERSDRSVMQWWANLGREPRSGPQVRFAPSLGADDDGEDLHLVLAAGLFVKNSSPAYLVAAVSSLRRHDSHSGGRARRHPSPWRRSLIVMQDGLPFSEPDPLPGALVQPSAAPPAYLGVFLFSDGTLTAVEPARRDRSARRRRSIRDSWSLGRAAGAAMSAAMAADANAKDPFSMRHSWTLGPNWELSEVRRVDAGDVVQDSLRVHQYTLRLRGPEGIVVDLGAPNKKVHVQWLVALYTLIHNRAPTPRDDVPTAPIESLFHPAAGAISPPWSPTLVFDTLAVPSSPFLARNSAALPLFCEIPVELALPDASSNVSPGASPCPSPAPPSTGPTAHIPRPPSLLVLAPAVEPSAPPLPAVPTYPDLVLHVEPRASTTITGPTTLPRIPSWMDQEPVFVIEQPDATTSCISAVPSSRASSLFAPSPLLPPLPLFPPTANSAPPSPCWRPVETPPLLARRPSLTLTLARRASEVVRRKKDRDDGLGIDAVDAAMADLVTYVPPVRATLGEVRRAAGAVEVGADMAMLFAPPESSEQVAVEEMQVVEVAVDDGLVAREEEAVEIPSTTPSLPTTPATEVPEPNLAMLSPPPSPPLLPPRHHHVAHFHHHHGMPTVIHRRTKPLPTTPPRSPTTTTDAAGDSSPSSKSSSVWSIGRAWRRLTRRRSATTATVRRRSSTASIPDADRAAVSATELKRRRWSWNVAVA
ncbi:hypothetical protein AMAG_07059 [Allomyces macrogynus ATCC 38327]|uniref:DH domain-containing protein n=1 Tax=Allomyces macrogynus (strain ATCC 38327) TaxID=578462 RepID=A0A0L0SFN0_ALLM3|nr:hypothetical protein AMAG_07059 [Allomyces macrogynus ATCC 38327]|eukprot:KNE61323.1 hypothetical protein AMAG_07059 [Allomyces macrogynus ATCC 38327]